MIANDEGDTIYDSFDELASPESAPDSPSEDATMAQLSFHAMTGTWAA